MSPAAPSAIHTAAGGLVLAIAERLTTAGAATTPDDIRQAAAELFGAERLAFRLRDDGAASLLRAASDELSTIAARPDQRHRLIELRRELALFINF